jgi:hypothetical protein
VRKEAVLKATGHSLSVAMSTVDVIDELVRLPAAACGGAPIVVRVADLAAPPRWPTSARPVRSKSTMARSSCSAGNRRQVVGMRMAPNSGSDPFVEGWLRSGAAISWCSCRRGAPPGCGGGTDIRGLPGT